MEMAKQLSTSPVQRNGYFLDTLLVSNLMNEQLQQSFSSVSNFSIINYSVSITTKHLPVNAFEIIFLGKSHVSAFFAMLKQL